MMTRLVRLFQLLIISLIAIDVRIQCFLQNPILQRNSFTTNIRISVDEDQLAQELKVDNHDEEEVEEGLIQKKEICVSASIDLPFDADIAFNAFVDLPRQPSWSSWLRSVTYNDDNDNSELKYSSCGIPLRSTKWTIGFRGLKFSWNAQSTTIDRPTKIEWISTSGLKNQGQVLFEENKDDDTTKMTLSMKFVAPRIVSSLFRRSSRISKFVEEKMLATTLQQFSEVVQEEDLKINKDEDDTD